MLSSILEAPSWDPKAPFQGISPEVGIGHGILLPTWLVKNRTVLPGGLSNLKLLYHVSECLGTLAATLADSHHRNCSSCSKVKLLQETRGQWPNDLYRESMFSDGMEITEQKPITKCVIPNTPLSHSQLYPH